ncbi:hypothetical protein PYW08_013100 [Mythimna loreyi]|uniref:Uncharacterized protein n=1 Tax=Mythimna loreyi TaxID=667449 RepID=A0ACC2PZC6_9NEOP|nr:hypothetical protein PYW08_013100 [Mythimna loreyi]
MSRKWRNLTSQDLESILGEWGDSEDGLDFSDDDDVADPTFTLQQNEHESSNEDPEEPPDLEIGVQDAATPETTSIYNQPSSTATESTLAIASPSTSSTAAPITSNRVPRTNMIWKTKSLNINDDQTRFLGSETLPPEILRLDTPFEFATKSELNDRINEYHKAVSFINQERNVNTRRGGGSFKLFDSGPMALPTLCGDESEVERNLLAHYPSLSLVQQPPSASSPSPAASASEPEMRVNETNIRDLSKEELPRSIPAPQSPAPNSEAADRCKQVNVTIEKRPLFSEVIQRESKL